MSVMSKTLHHHLPSSPIKLVHEEALLPTKQGIVTILGSNTEGGSTKSTSSIRRTLSADMSSQKWLSQNGFFSPTKKTESSEYEKIPNQDDVWKSIQSKKEKEEKPEGWGSILTQKNGDKVEKPYVHPLVKRSKSLSEKSLEICTESLGSETGSDVFSSDFSDEDKEDRRKFVMAQDHDYQLFEDLHVVKYKKSPVRPFPPPLPSIGGGADGAAGIHMSSRRENGRLVLEAVTVPTRNCFKAQRLDGRLVLSLVNKEAVVEEEKVFDMEEEEEEEEKADDGGDDVDAEEEEAAEEKVVVERNMNSLPSGVVMKKLMAFRNKNPTWSNEKVVTADVEEEEKVPIPHSLPPAPRAAMMIPKAAPPAVASLNPYEYFWRNKTTVSGGGFITTATQQKSNGGYENQNKGDYFVGCKEARRSLLIWKPYCIAT